MQAYALIEGDLVVAKDDGGLYMRCDVQALIDQLSAKWEAEIAVAYNEYSQGQRAGLEQAAQELRASLGKGQ
jgi:hypothetical protein